MILIIWYLLQEDKRAKIEQRLEENARQEKESLRKERHELFLERRRQQAHVRRLEWKMHRLREVSVENFNFGYHNNK